MQVPFSLVFTKTDKKKKRAPGPQENIAAFKRQLLQAWEVPEHPPPSPPHSPSLPRVIYCRHHTRRLLRCFGPHRPLQRTTERIVLDSIHFGLRFGHCSDCTAWTSARWWSIYSKVTWS